MMAPECGGLTIPSCTRPQIERAPTLTPAVPVVQDSTRPVMPEIGMEDVLLRVTIDYGFPILKVEDFGHNCPNMVLPVCGKVKIDSHQRMIEILEACVR